MMIKKFKDFLKESIEEIKKEEKKNNNNITIKKDKKNEEVEDFLAMYYCGVFDDLFK